MRFNHKLAESFISDARAEGKDVKTVTIQIDEIQRKLARSGDYVITLVGKDGQRYTAFERIWDAQSINVDDLEEGDELEVTYMINGDYKNFLKVEIVPKNEPDDGLPF